MSDAHEPQHESDPGNETDFQQWGDEVGDAPDLPSGAAGTASAETTADANPELDAAKQALAERTEDLQRLQAEYVNYKRRVDRDRDVARHAGVESVVADLLPVLDAIDSAREHGELTGGFKLVADELGRLGQKYGLEAYGEPGDEFDPHIHEAMMTAPSTPGQTSAQAATVLQRGYRLGERIVRHARVAVSEPDPGAASDATDTTH